MISGPQAHLLLNHLPIVGFVLLTPFFVLVFLGKNFVLKRLMLLAMVFVGSLSLPAYFTGEPAEEGIEHLSGISQDLIEEHEEVAEKGLIAALITSALALAVWWFGRRSQDITNKGMLVVALAAIVATVILGVAGHEGGKIRHPEIMQSSELSPQ